MCFSIWKSLRRARYREFSSNEWVPVVDVDSLLDLMKQLPENFVHTYLQCLYRKDQPLLSANSEATNLNCS